MDIKITKVREREDGGADVEVNYDAEALAFMVEFFVKETMKRYVEEAEADQELIDDDDRTNLEGC